MSYITKVLLTIQHDKPIEDLLDKVVDRVYTLDGMVARGDVLAEVLEEISAKQLHAEGFNSGRKLEELRAAIEILKKEEKYEGDKFYKIAKQLRQLEALE